MNPPTPNPETHHENYRVVVSHDNMGIRNNKFASKRCDILVSKYPDSFVKNEISEIEIGFRRKINIYCSAGI